jgi:hypothetical protein
MEHPVRPPLIVVKRVYFEQYAAGVKTIEYRRHRPPFAAHTFYPGRWVRIAYNFDVKRFPSLLARVISFDVAPARDHPALIEVYPTLLPDDELVLIALAIERQVDGRK